LEELVLAAATAWMPKVVPVMTLAWPSVVMVVVMVAGLGVAVVVEQPDQVPVHELNGPQPAVHVVHEPQLTSLALVPHGPPQPPAPPGPPKPPGPPQPPCPDHGPLPGAQPLGAPGRPVDRAETQLDHWPEFQPPLGPKPGPAVISEGQAEPPEVALKVASWVAETVTPLLAQSWATAP